MLCLKIFVYSSKEVSLFVSSIIIILVNGKKISASKIHSVKDNVIGFNLNKWWEFKTIWWVHKWQKQSDHRKKIKFTNGDIINTKVDIENLSRNERKNNLSKDGVKDKISMKEKIVMDKNSRPTNEDIQ